MDNEDMACYGLQTDRAVNLTLPEW